MGSPVSPADVVALITKAYELYEKIKNQPEQIAKIGQRLPRLKDYLAELSELTNTKHNPQGLANLRPTQKKRLDDLIKDVKADVNQIYGLLKKWHQNIGPGGMVLRFDWVAHVIFTLGSSPDKLDALQESIELHMNDINRWVVLLSAFAHNANLQSPIPQQPQRSKSPSPAPKAAPTMKQNISVAFIDGYNIGRSRIAESYLQLLAESTLREQKPFPVSKIASMGLFIKNTSGCTAELTSLDIKLKKDGSNANFVGMDSLFDNKLFSKGNYKRAIQNKAIEQKAKGISRDVFAKNDYIIAFTKAQQVKITKLRDILVKQDPKNRPKGKGQIVLIGDYTKKLEIFEARPDTDRQAWNAVTGEIKAAVKTFLKKELGWTR